MSWKWNRQAGYIIPGPTTWMIIGSFFNNRPTLANTREGLLRSSVRSVLHPLMYGRRYTENLCGYRGEGSDLLSQETIPLQASSQPVFRLAIYSQNALLKNETC